HAREVTELAVPRDSRRAPRTAGALAARDRDDARRPRREARAASALVLLDFAVADDVAAVHDDGVVPGAAVDGVVLAVLHVDRVVAAARIDDVDPAAAFDRVVAGAGLDVVVAGAAVDDEVAVAGGDQVVACSA